jgi:hypothetical protein
MNYKDMLISGAMGAAAVFIARKIPPIEKVLDGAPANIQRADIGLPHLAVSANGFPLIYAVAPAVAAFAVAKYL